MKIQPNYNINPAVRISSKGRLDLLVNANPLSRSAKNYFNKVAQKSTFQIEPLQSSLLTIFSKEVFNNISAWNFNNGKSEKYVMFLHGMAQNVSNYQRLYDSVLEKNYNVFALEYRGYGENGVRKISESKLIKDVESGYKYLVEEKKVKPENITLVGHSMGGALAVDLATKHPEVKNLILIAPLSKLSYISEKFTLNSTLGIGASKKMKNITDKFAPFKWLYDRTFNSINKIKKVKVPTYIIHSKSDRVSEVEGAWDLIKAARKANILERAYIIENRGHQVDKQKIDLVSQILEKENNKEL